MLFSQRNWATFLCGLCMGTADLLPGLSGGTIAFILGFYQPLVESLNVLNLKTLKKLCRREPLNGDERASFSFLFFLLLAMGLALFSFATLLRLLLQDPLYRLSLYSLFCGLIFASFVLCLKEVSMWNTPRFFLLILGFLIAYFLTEAAPKSLKRESYQVALVLNPTKAVSNYDVENALLKDVSAEELHSLLTKKAINQQALLYDHEGLFLGEAGEYARQPERGAFRLWLFSAGALAICALLLPGISGSHLLMLMGVYPVVIDALVDFSSSLRSFHFDSASFEVLFFIGLGILSGAAAFGRYLSWLMEHHRESSLVLLSGFMMGGTKTIWPFWTYEYAFIPEKIERGAQLILLDPYWPSLYSPDLFKALFFSAFGFLAVFFLSQLSSKKRETSASFQSK